ncbi:FAD-dependent oxidoreductase [Beijerinckiaceae bacterium]|nr:FAD-dependent oxidoreductase [Beijerinckiaceae bacterium]
MVERSDDRRLGMHRSITRRDFLDGLAVAAGAAAIDGGLGKAFAQASVYPPALMGLRGQTDADFNAMHAIRSGDFWVNAGTPESTGEHYDLIVIGAGISGLAAAFLFRQRMGGDARILILDNTDDFGGHAKRNEFTASNGRLIIGYGGSQSLQSPSFFSPAVAKLIADLNIDLERFNTWYDRDWATRHDLAAGVFFRKEHFTRDATLRLSEKAAGWVSNAPMNDKAKQDLIALIDTPLDYFAGKSRAEKREILAATTYADFLAKIVGADPEVVAYFKKSTAEYFGVGIHATSSLDAWAAGLPGFDKMDLGEAVDPAMSPSGRLLFKAADNYIYHFPDGNASLARAIVRGLIPAAVAGATMEDLVLNKTEYGRLDEALSKIRIRLQAPCVKLRHLGAPATAQRVEVTYLQGGRLKTATAGRSVIACWHREIHLMCDEIGVAQKTALDDQQKVPLVYANVLIRNWSAFSKLGLSGFTDPTGFWDGAFLDYPVSVGTYRFPEDPSEPMLLHLPKIAVVGNGAPREQSLEGRRGLLGISFEDYEREIRDLLARALGPGGFDPAADIEAITVNRWSHGYTYEYMRPWDAYWPAGSMPIEVSRKGWGRIAIANADAGAYAYANSSIDQAARAVTELLGPVPGAPAFASFPGPPLNMIGL